MYLHLGQDRLIRLTDLLGIFDLDNTSSSRRTQDFLARAEREGRVINASDGLPKSFILCREGDRDLIYLSQISAATLLKRISQPVSAPWGSGAAITAESTERRPNHE